MKIPNSDQISIGLDGRYRSKSLSRSSGTVITLPEKIVVTPNLWNEKLNNPDSLIVLDLFCGAGGLSLGFEDAGFFIAAGVDKEVNSIKTHSYNFISKSCCVDISDIDDPKEFIHSLGLPRVDILIGGPPCQGFSRVGRAKLRSINLESYYHEVINTLYKEFLRFVETLNPLAFVMENVPDMARFNNGELVNRIKQSVFDLGYCVDAKVLDASNYGVPQKRKRLFIQGNRFNQPIVWPTPRLFKENILTLQDAIGDLPFKTPPAIDEVLTYTAENPTPYQKLMRAGMSKDEANLVFDHIIRQVREDDKFIFSLMDEGQKYRDIPEQFRRYRSDIFLDKYSKLIWNKPSWTITAHIQKDAYRYIHPDKAQGRMLSIREFARIQSFPDHFRFCGAPTRRMQQIGNAVPPLLAKEIALELYNQIHLIRGTLPTQTSNVLTHQ